MWYRPDPHGALFRLDGPNDAFYLVQSVRKERVGNHVSHRYWLLSRDGQVVGEYAPEFFCDQEVGYSVVYELRDGTLLKLFGRDNDASTRALTEWKEVEIILHAWRELGPEDEEWQALRGGA